MMIKSLHHVQLAMPRGGESQAKTFYGELLELPEREKPETLRDRGGCWFEHGELRVHLGVEESFQPARKAHPAFAVADLSELEQRFEAAGIDVRPGNKIDGLERFFVDDPFGNRVEFVQGGQSA